MNQQLQNLESGSLVFAAAIIFSLLLIELPILVIKWREYRRLREMAAPLALFVKMLFVVGTVLVAIVLRGLVVVPTVLESSPWPQIAGALIAVILVLPFQRLARWLESRHSR